MNKTKYLLLVIGFCVFPLFQAISQELPEPEGLKIAAEFEFMAPQLATFVNYFDVHFLFEKYGQPGESDWANLPPAEQAAKVIGVTGKFSAKDQHFEDLRLRHDVSDEIRAAFSKYVWSQDNYNVLEFRYKEPVFSSNAFLAEVTAFATITGVLDELLNPPLLKWEENPDSRRFSNHRHMSVEGRDFSQGVAQRLNYLHFLERVKIGLRSDFKNRSKVSPTNYRSNVTNKGLIRLFNKDRIETRRPVALLEDLRRTLELAIVPETAAIEMLDREIDAAIANSDVLDVIWGYDAEFLVDGLDYSPRIFQFLLKQVEITPENSKVERIFRSYLSKDFVSFLPHIDFVNNPQPFNKIEKLPITFKHFDWEALERISAPTMKQTLDDLKNAHQQYIENCERALVPQVA